MKHWILLIGIFVCATGCMSAGNEVSPSPSPATLPQRSHLVTAEGVASLGFALGAGPFGYISSDPATLRFDDVARFERGEIVMTWTATTPLTSSMSFVLVLEGEDDGLLIRGSSPLKVEFGPKEVPAASAYEVVIVPPEDDDVFTQASQDVDVTLTLTLL
jgi:hypothetical protein